MSLRISSKRNSNITFSGKYSRTISVKTSDIIIPHPAIISSRNSHQHLAAPRRLEVTVLNLAPMQAQSRTPGADRFSRSAYMIERLRRESLYTEKRVRDRLFTAMESALAMSPTPPLLSRLVRDAANQARREANRDAFAFSHWEIAARAVSNAMLGARTFLTENGVPLEPGVRAQAATVRALKPGFRDLTEAFLLELLIARLGDVSTRDHVPLAHALFRQFDTRVSQADLEDRVVTLLASLHGRITLRGDGIYALLYHRRPLAAAAGVGQ